ncbi:ketosteroid isomerase-like protein [Pedobacter sp. CG_S7]|uniref:YybH family protein n=1 Tax=Pedobacter sp. CG_S7 TaxID=3143930 RepID=UPI0033909DEC
MKINKFIYTLFVASLTFGAYAQKPEGTTKSLVSAEKEFAASAAKSSEKSAFLAHAAPDAIVFRPNPVNVKSYYASQEDHKNLSWTPVYAKVSRSGDWGFTTGPFVLNGSEKEYGQYLSIWKMVNGKWVLTLDIGATHNKPLNTVSTNFKEPTSFYKPKFNTEKQIAAGKDIILTTEKTLNATIKSYGAAAFSGFVNADAYLIFPGREPIIGKDNILAFYNSMVSKMNIKTTNVEKALGGDLAYTYGVATIDYKAELRESFNYVFIYERQADYSWNIAMQVFTPADR